MSSKTYLSRAALRGSVLVAALGPLFLVSGCATSGFEVAAARHEEIPLHAASYRLVYGDPGPLANDPRVRETIQRVKGALAEKGLAEAAVGAPAGMEIDLHFGQGTPATIMIPEVENLSRLPDWPSNRVIVAEAEAKLNNSYRDESGYLVRMRPATAQPKFLEITARETPEVAGRNAPRVFWSVSVSKDDESAFASCLPAMVAVARSKIPFAAVGRGDSEIARVSNQPKEALADSRPVGTH